MHVVRPAKLPPTVEGFEVPDWAGKPAAGLHLDVLKERDGEMRMIQKMMVDEKKAYYFGRNHLYCDFTIDHASCSRVHAVLLYHKHLGKSFLIDLNSAHGTFIGSLRLESFKPTQLHIDSVISFGASTRQYILRERPQTTEDAMLSENVTARGLARFGLPNDEGALDNLTEFNTAHNKRIAILANLEENPGEPNPAKRRRIGGVRFREEEDVINPEDIDPTVGKFRNMVQTAVIPKSQLNRGPPLDELLISPTGHSSLHHHHILRPIKDDMTSPTGLYAGIADNPISSIRVNSAPDVDLSVPIEVPAVTAPVVTLEQEPDLGPKKKYFPKEAWPGKKPTGGMMI